MSTSKPGYRDIVRYKWGISSGHRVLSTVTGYRKRYGAWPTRLLVHEGTADALRREIFTRLGWAMLEARLNVVPIAEGTLFAEGPNGERHEYDCDMDFSGVGQRADVWIWGLDLTRVPDL